MENTQLFELLQVLSPEEAEYLLEFARLRQFNSGRMKQFVEPLLRICIAALQSNDEKSINKSTIYSQLFEGQPFVEGKLEKVMVDAQKVVKSFLIVNRYTRDENEFWHQYDITEILRQRGLISRYKLSMEKLIKYQSDYPFRDVQYYLKQLQLETAIHYHESIRNQQKNDLNIPNVLYNTECYFYIRKFALLSRYLLQQYVTKLDPPAVIQRHLENHVVPAELLEEVPVMNLYYKIFQTHIKKTPDLADIEAIQSLLHKHEYSIDWETLHELYIHLRNIVLIMLGADRDRKELLEVVHNLYVDSLQRGYLHFENKLPASRYLAVTENALKINQFEWVRDFIESNKDQLHNENENHDIYHFVKARYLFAIGQFEECLDILPDTSPFVDFMLLGKRLELKVLYEIKSDLLSYKLDAFKMFLSRTSTKILSDIQRRTHVDFTNLLTQIISSIPGDKTRAEKLLNRIQDNKQVAERIWLSEKAAELKKG